MTRPTLPPAARGGAPSPEADEAPTSVAELRQEIVRRMSRGDGLEDVRRELIDRSPLGEAQRTALWLYAWSRPEHLAQVRPLGRAERAGA